MTAGNRVQGLAAALVVLAVGAAGAGRVEAQGRTMRGAAPPDITAGGQTNWTSHNLDLANRRYSTLDAIDTANVGRLTEQWSVAVPAGVNVGQVTPLVVDGLLYVHAGASVIAVNRQRRQGIKNARVQQNCTRANRAGDTKSLVETRGRRVPPPRRELERRKTLRSGLASGYVESHFHVEGDLSDLGLGPVHLCSFCQELVNRRSRLYTAGSDRASKKCKALKSRPRRQLPPDRASLTPPAESGRRSR